ncbi:MAG: peptidoglycan-binding protein [Desulfatibacillaceae bacterium]
MATENDPPYAMYENRDVSGLGTKTVAAVLQRLGTGAEFSLYKRSVPERLVKGGAMDGLYPVAMRDDLLETCHYPAEPLFVEKRLFLIRVETAGSFTFETWDDLASATVGYVEGEELPGKLAGYLAGHDRVVEAESLRNLLVQLVRENVDYAFAELGAAAHILYEMGVAERVAAIDRPLARTPMYVVFNKDNVPLSFVDSFSAELAAFRASPEYNTLYGKYISVAILEQEATVDEDKAEAGEGTDTGDGKDAEPETGLEETGAKEESGEAGESEPEARDEQPPAEVRNDDIPLKEGSRGANVKKVQEALLTMGYYPGPVDGVYGPALAFAVRVFQQDAGLGADGVVGANTWRTIFKEYGLPDQLPISPGMSAAPVTTPAVEDKAGPAAPEENGPLEVGSRGTKVRRLQGALMAFGYYPGPVDGVFSGEVENALKVFQEDHGLVSDGVAGPDTFRELGLAWD